MKIEHLAIWVEDIEGMRRFYEHYFGAASNDKYVNPLKKYTSYFLSFEGGDCRIELMQRPDIIEEPARRGFVKGIAHFSFSVGSKEKVDALTERLRAAGYTVASEPRTTGDGYYESAVLDPEGNYVEISD